MQRKSRVFLIITGSLLLLALIAGAATVVGKEKYNFRGRTVTYSAWWELRPQPGASVEMDRQIRRVAEVEKKYNVKIDYVNIRWGEYLARHITTVMAWVGNAGAGSVGVNLFRATLPI